MKTVYILGAGVDVPFGLPLADGLLRELGSFAKGEGQNVSKALKDKLGGGRRVRFSFDKYVSNQSETFAERILTDRSLSENIEGALAKLPANGSESATAISKMVTQLRTISEANELDEPTAVAIAKFGGEAEDMADLSILRMRGVALNPAPRSAMLQVFRAAQAQEDLTAEERAALGDVVATMTNFEDLLTELFAGFYSDKISDIRNYLYVAWLLWAYMRWKSIQARSEPEDTKSFYQHVADIGSEDSVITFNYTTIGDSPADQTVWFHGDCLSYIRHDRGELIQGDDGVVEAQGLDDLATFISGLEMDVDEKKFLLPAVVPPSALKPVINREFISRWSKAEQVMKDADLLIAVGYAFNRVDSHFNDLFRYAATGKRVAVINPALEESRMAVTRILGVEPSSLTTMTKFGFEVLRSDNQLFVPLKGEDVTTEVLSSLKSGW